MQIYFRMWMVAINYCFNNEEICRYTYISNRRTCYRNYTNLQ